MPKEFKDFVSRGNVVDMAAGIIIDAAFGGVVVLNGKYYPDAQAAQSASAPAIYYGQFVNTVIDFLIVALVIFLLVKGIKCPNCTCDLKSEAARAI